MRGDIPKRAIFLDRDGTLIIERNYLADPTLVTLEANAGHALRRLSADGFALVVITNQSGVGRGMLSMGDVKAVNARMIDLLRNEGVVIAGCYVCQHHPDVGCTCRKPMPGLALRAADELSLDLCRSTVIGDRGSDMLLARNAGARGVLVTSGYGKDHTTWARAQGFDVVTDLAAAADLILSPAREARHAQPG